MVKTTQEVINLVFDEGASGLRIASGPGAKSVRLAYDSDGNLIYKGESSPGAGEMDAKWQIQKFEYDANGNLIAILFAEGSAEYNKVWGNRETYNYI